ncbi:S-isoprenylcysteine O-methyltransferase (macronuclear) [Tetrahymena thermophila SB210]|uniref:Protein-S-isoprenylcysteine O-methyltransferase n=1 Tax=Tetrahymena thermophila (strain SB210) TaxID=312017 RepID=I7M0R4_TETTS|nr:S-isoprenylcysteine O-methyltransferase [Tetrahymena thermophila SB210]EAR90793.3 S-isoprenylcysteine O-methyltransferase [Tetrahymena thermophila SB210]|eukprot:XP_001011038.3 S-isoprenylcysteine O-methyltransferase [Tetrahymena thermophila SB210]
MEVNKETKKVLNQASQTASCVVIIAYFIGLVLPNFINQFQLSIINYAISTIIGIILFYCFFYLFENSFSRMYSQTRYFHFYLTSFIFGQITQWAFCTIILQKDYFLLSLKFFLLNNIVFHLGEFYFVCLSHPKDLAWKSFLINHSPAYNIAFVVALLEYILGVFFPNFIIFYFHDKFFIIMIGVFFSIFGHFMRISAQQTAKSNFNHLVQNQKSDDHVLVTHGVYSFSRHPSYLGFFSYSLGGQIILGNLFCFFAYAFVLYKFFLYRIVQEEHYLVKFFGQQYIDYSKIVPIRIPFMEYAIHKVFKCDDDDD